MPKTVIKPKLLIRSIERTSVPVASRSKIGMDIKEISKYKNIEKKLTNPNEHMRHLTPEEREYYTSMKKRIWQVHDKNIELRSKKLRDQFGFKTINERSRYISDTYPNHISVSLNPKSKYNSISNPTAISFKWKYDKNTNTVHMFEWNNNYGLTSKSPLYKEFKEITIKGIKESFKQTLYEDTKFVVDSEIIDK